MSAAASRADAPALDVRDLDKTFTLHVQGGVELSVLRRVSLRVWPGECVIIDAPSGAGKSTLLRAIYGNYLAGGGRIAVRHEGREVDMVTAGAREVLAVRRRTLGYVSQFLRVVPRVSAVDVVAEPLRALGAPAEEDADRARGLLARLGIAERLWGLSPATFSGGERQRVNLARGFIAGFSILLLDEPTASLDAAARGPVIDLILEARAGGAAILGALHDVGVRDAVASRLVGLAPEEVRV